MKKTRSLLITFSGYPYTPSSFLPDNGLANLAACLKEAGHQTLILDFNTPHTMEGLVSDEWKEINQHIVDDISQWSSKNTSFSGIHKKLNKIDQLLTQGFKHIAHQICQTIEKEKIDWVGLKVWNGDGYTASCVIAKMIKKNFKNMPILAGGPQIDWFGPFFLEVSPHFDFAAFGEGEPTVVAFAEMVLGQRKLSEVPNLYYRKGKKIQQTQVVRVKNLDTIPTACYDEDVYPALYTNQKINIGILEESRGCPIQCYFCEHPIKSGAVLRKKSIARVIEDVKNFQKTPGFQAYKLAGSFTPSKHIQQIAKALLDLPFPIQYVAFGHLKDSGNDFDLLKRSGCVALFFGLETGSDLILDSKMKKGYERQQALKALKDCKNAGIFSITSIIYPSAGETEESRQATLDFIEEIQPDSIPCHFPIILPRTRWCLEPERFGFSFNAPYHHMKDYLSFFINYKPRLLYPPEFWPPLPYKIDDKPFSVFAKETSKMTQTLEDRGHLTLMSDEVMLIGKHSQKPFNHFRDECRKALFYGDSQKLKTLVSDVNSSLKQMKCTIP
ncbi:MAG: radical SAM protein [Deltaproteobacteria bacterium]|nr:radical SAM protein [Deltaproteobacteria bacterium]